MSDPIIKAPVVADPAKPVSVEGLSGEVFFLADPVHVEGPKPEEQQESHPEEGLLWQYVDPDTGDKGGKVFADEKPGPNFVAVIRTVDVPAPLYYQEDGSKGFAVTDKPVLSYGSISARLVYRDQYGGTSLRSSTFSHAEMPRPIVEQGIAWGQAVLAWVEENAESV